MKKSIAILSMALLAGNAFAADILEAGTAAAPKYYVIKANRGIPYVTYTADAKNNNGAETTLYRANELSEAAVWGVVAGAEEGTVNIFNYTTRNDENKAYMFSFNNGTATTGDVQNVFIKDNGNGSYGLALNNASGVYNGAFYALDATGGTSQFMGNWQNIADGGTQWWFTAIDASNIEGSFQSILRQEMDALIATYSNSMATYAAAVPWVADDLNAGIAALDKLEYSDDYEAKITAVWNQYIGQANSNLNTVLNGKTVAFKNLRRAANGKINPFIAIGETNYPMAESYATDPNAIFTLESSSDAYYMYNAATQKYYGAGNVPVATKEEASTISLMLNSNSGFTGVNILANGVTSGNYAFNVDQNGNPLTYWSGADGGSIWSVIEFDVDAALKDVIDGVKSALEAYIPNVPASVADVLQAAITEADALTYTADLTEKADAILNNAIAAANEILKNDLNGKKYALKALRNGYILVTEGEELVNAVSAEESDNTVYTFTKAEDGGYIIFSPAVEKYFGPLVKDETSGETYVSLVADAADAIKVYPVLNKNGNFYGISLPFTDGGTQGLNANARGLHGYNINDGGSIFSLAEKEDEPVIDDTEKTTIIDFNENSFGLSATSDNNAEYVKDFSCSEGPVKIELDAASGNGVRYWLYNGTPQLRLYNKSNLTISINKGQIKKIQIKGGGLNQCTYPKGFEKEEWPMPTSSNTTYLPSEDYPVDDYSSATFTAAGTVQFNQIIVTYTGGIDWPGLADPELTIVGGENEFTVALGDEFTAPQITKATTAPLTYTSSKTDVATVDEEGNVTIVGIGTAKITASVAKTDEFKAGSVSYTLNVIKPLPEGTIFNSVMGTDFTFINPEMPEVWKHDNTYGLKGSGYETINWVAEAYAVSPEITIPAGREAALYFDQAINYLKGNPIANNCNVVVRIIGDAAVEEDEPYYYDTDAEWIAIENAVTAPASDSWTFYANAPVDLTAFAGKIIQIGFKYNSTGTLACTWEINNIVVTAIDPLKGIKEAAIAEITKYFDHIPGDHSWDLMYYTETINDCSDVDEVTTILQAILDQLASQYASNLEMNFFFAVGDKFGAYVKPAAEGVNAWQVVDELAANAVFAGKRVNERSWMPWSATYTEGETAERESNNEDAMMLYNVLTGYYLGQPTAAGEAIPVVEDEAEAGYWFVKTIDGQFAIADDASGDLYLFWDETKGLIASETAATFPVDEIPVWDNGYCDYYVSIIVPTEGTDEWGRPIAEEIKSFDVYASTAATLTGIGGIQCYTYDPRTDEKIVLANISAAQLADLTPEQTTGIYKKTVGWDANGPVYEEIEFEANLYHVTLNANMGREEGETEGITTPGDYFFEALEGTWIVSDETEGKLFSPEVHEQVSILGEVEPGEGFAIESDPVDGAVLDEISSIFICPEIGYCSIVWSNPEGTNIVFSSGENVIKTWTPDEVLLCALEKEDFFNDPDIFELKLDETITAAGTYSLYIPEGFFEGDDDSKNVETILTWTIEDGEDGITTITIKGDDAIYDLQGRRMNAASKGIFIINGKKVLVK